MQCLMSLYQTLQGNKRKAKSPARHREAHRSRLVRLGCEVMEDRVLMSAGLPDYHFTAPALVAGTTQHNAPSSIGAFTKTPGGTTQRIVSNGSMQAVAPAAPSFTATAVSGTQINLAWTPVAGATGYQIHVWNGDTEVNDNLSSNYTGWAVTDLSPNTTYNLDVAAYNAAGTTWANSQAQRHYPKTPFLRRPRLSRPRRFQRRRSTWPGPRWPARPATWSMNGSTASGSRSAAWAAAAPATRSPA